jgi:uncharacterized protein
MLLFIGGIDMKEAVPGVMALKDLGMNQVELTGAYHLSAFEKEMAASPS